MAIDAGQEDLSRIIVTPAVQVFKDILQTRQDEAVQMPVWMIGNQPTGDLPQLPPPYADNLGIDDHRPRISADPETPLPALDLPARVSAELVALLIEGWSA